MFLVDSRALFSHDLLGYMWFQFRVSKYLILESCWKEWGCSKKDKTLEFETLQISSLHMLMVQC